MLVSELFFVKASGKPGRPGRPPMPNPKPDIVEQTTM